MIPQRCAWCLSDPLYVQYHDDEWGVPCHQDQTLFEFLVLEGAQAGLSWLTVLKKRSGYRAAFCDFDPERVACFSNDDQARLLANPGIIRNRRKIASAVHNARAFLAVQAHYGSFSAYLWQWVDGEPVQNHWRSLAEVPVTTPLSDRLSRALKQQGFSFVGSTICYAYMQAVGLVNDHLVSCPRHGQRGSSAQHAD